MRGVRALVGGYALFVALCAPSVLSAAETAEPATSGGAVIAPGGSGEDAGGASISVTSPGGRADHAVSMHNYKFNPKEIVVEVGDTVTWTNQDSAEHNAIAEDDSFRTPTFGEGESESVTISEPGTYPYFCSLHSNMEGRISTRGEEPSGEEGGGSGGGGSGGGSGSSGSTGSSSGDTPLIPGGSGSATSTGSSSGTGGSSASGGSSGSLPVTGSDSVWLAVAGAWLLAVGFAVRTAVANRA